MSPAAASPARRRTAGLLVPLFALRGARDWGIGEIGDLPGLAAWMASAGHRLLQLLPVLEMSPGERSPYAASSAFAIDPIYLTLGDVEDFAAAGGEAALGAEERAAIERVRAHPAIDYDGVRRAKRRALERAFAHFLATEWRSASVRALAFRRFRQAEAGWLADYGLFRARQDRDPQHTWQDWEPPLRDRVPEAIEVARRALGDAALFHEYVQWLAAAQWDAARRGASAAGVQLKGDVPFMVSFHSADVWARQGQFRLDAGLGAPPDAFNADGQAWGLPVPRWEVMAGDDLAWLRARAARAAAMFDAFRVDHVVGFYRMYVIPAAGAPGAFVPAARAEQAALGERLLGAALGAAVGAFVVGEDLGFVPPFVRRSLTRLGIPGYRVLRWEEEGGVFRDPRHYPALSVATSGTHDTTTLAVWWEEDLGERQRRALAAVPAFASLRDAGGRWTPAVRTALLEGLYGAGSELVVLPVQDAYDGRERINVPGTVGASNWAYRLPWTIDELRAGAATACGERLRALAARHGR